MASGTIKAVASKADIANKPDGIYLGSSDTTWADVWAKISTLTTGRCTTFYATSDAAKVLTDNARGNTMYGTIARQTSSNFFLVIGHSVSNCLFSVAVLSANSTGVTSYKENNIAENAVTQKSLTITDGTVLEVDSSSKINMVLFSAANARCGTIQLYTSSSNAYVYMNVNGASAVTITKDGRKLTFGVNGTVYANCTIYAGDINVSS